MGQNPVQRDPSFFIRIEALVEKVAQKTPVLRDAFTVDPLRRSKGIRIVFRVGSKVSYGRKASPGDDGVGNHVDVFINLSWPEPSLSSE